MNRVPDVSRRQRPTPELTDAFARLARTSIARLLFLVSTWLVLLSIRLINVGLRVAPWLKPERKP